MDADQIIMSLPAVYRQNFGAEQAPPVQPVTGYGSALANLDAIEIEEVQPEEVEVEQPVNVVGALFPKNSNVQIFYSRYKITGSIQVPGNGTFWMNFQNVLVAEDKLVNARRDANDAAFSRMLYREYLEPMRPINVDGDRSSYAYRFAGSPFYDKGWFEDVWCGCAFAIPIWKGNQMANLWIVDGSRLYDVELRENPNSAKNPKAPMWEGTVRG